MLAHTLLIRLPQTAPSKALDRFFGILHELKNTLPGVMQFQYGKRLALPASNSTFTHAFSAIFADQTYLEDYLNHQQYLDALSHLRQLLADEDALVSFSYTVNGG